VVGWEKKIIGKKSSFCQLLVVRSTWARHSFRKPLRMYWKTGLKLNNMISRCAAGFAVGYKKGSFSFYSLKKSQMYVWMYVSVE